MMRLRFFRNLFVVIILFFLITGSICRWPFGPEPPDPHRYIRGQVILENQTRHGNCPVVLDSVAIGTLTDETGCYEILIPDSLSGLTGLFNLYFYLYDYELDTLSVMIENGKVVWGEADVSDEGRVETLLLEQLISVTVTADKDTYLINEDIHLHYELTNVSSHEIGISAPNVRYILFYNIDTKTDSWISLGQDPTGEYIPIDPNESLESGETIQWPSPGRGYFWIWYMLIENRYVGGFPNALRTYLFYLDSAYSNIVYFAGFLIMDDLKNIQLPLVEIIEDSLLWSQR